MGRFKIENKVQYVTGTLFAMLENDMRTVVEARCAEHGIKGSGPNFTAILLCLIACEVAALLSTDRGLSKRAAIRSFLSRVGELANDERYAPLAGPLFGFFRHGIAHTFLPLAVEGVYGSGAWAFECPEWLDSDAGAARCEAVRRGEHLVVKKVSDLRTFQVVPQILYIDVRRALRAYTAELKSGKVDLTAFAENFNSWELSNQKLEASYLNDSERLALGMGLKLPSSGKRGSRATSKPNG